MLFHQNFHIIFSQSALPISTYLPNHSPHHLLEILQFLQFRFIVFIHIFGPDEVQRDFENATGTKMPRGQVNGITIFVSVHVQHPSIFPVVCMMLLCPSILSTPSSLICLQAPEKRCCSLHLPSL